MLVLMMMFMLVFMLVLMIVLVGLVAEGMGLVFLGLGDGALYFADPCGGGGHVLEVEEPGVEDLVEVDVGIVALDDAGLGLDGADDGLDALGVGGCDLGNLVEENYVAEFNLLDDEVLDVVLVEVFALEGFAVGELAL